KQILGKTNEAIQAELFDKRIGEAEKLKAEASKISKEAENLMDKDDAEIINHLEVQRKTLEVFEKQVDIELKMEDLKAKKLNNIERTSELIKNGLINNDSDFKLEINNLLFLENKNGIRPGEDIDLIDGRGT